MHMKQKIYGIVETAKELGVSHNTVKAWMKSLDLEYTLRILTTRGISPETLKRLRSHAKTRK